MSIIAVKPKPQNPTGICFTQQICVVTSVFTRSFYIIWHVQKLSILLAAEQRSSSLLVWCSAPTTRHSWPRKQPHTQFPGWLHGHKTIWFNSPCIFTAVLYQEPNKEDSAPPTEAAEHKSDTLILESMCHCNWRRICRNVYDLCTTSCLTFQSN